jgi:hypothetical protein
MSNTTRDQKIAGVLATKDAMVIILDEAKQTIATKQNTTVEMVNLAIEQKNENVLTMIMELIALGVEAVADSME